MSAEQLELLIKNSPLVAIILLILWQYRRDYLKIFKQAEDLSQEFIGILKEVVSSLERNRSATEENSRIILSLLHPDERQKIQTERLRGNQ